MPYSASALGVLPPLWSRAAKKPRPVLTFSAWVVFTLPYSGTSPTGPAPVGMTGAMSAAVTAVPRAGRQQAARRPTAPIGRMFKRCPSSPVCVPKKNLNTETGISPVSGRAGARSPGMAAYRRDIIGYHQEVGVTDVLIRDVPDDVIAAVDAHAGRLGLSRSEYVRRRLAQDAATPGSRVSVEDLARFAETFGDLADPDVMSQAWR